MADEEKTEQAAAPEAKPGMTKQKKMMIFGGIFVVQLIAVIGLGQVLIKPKLVPPDTSAVVEDETPDRGTIVMLEDITVNLLAEKRTHYLRLKIGLEVADPLVEAEIAERSAEIRDIVITSASERRVDELITVRGKEQLKEELRNRINARLQQGELLNVYFSDFVVQ